MNFMLLTMFSIVDMEKYEHQEEVPDLPINFSRQIRLMVLPSCLFSLWGIHFANFT